MGYTDIRKQMVDTILNVASISKEGHIPSSLSILDILYCLYQNFIVDNQQNRFILSKGHSALGLYIVLNKFNLIDTETLYSFCKHESILGGHPTIKIPHVESSTGSLGHGMPMAVGIALAKKIKKENGQIFCLIGDGEANEGTIWESSLLANHHKLNNFCCIMDYNRSTDRAIDINPVLDKFKSFGFSCFSVDGHDITEINNALFICSSINSPSFILAHTIKGKGIPYMENNPEWHHKIPNKQNE